MEAMDRGEMLRSLLPSWQELNMSLLTAVLLLLLVTLLNFNIGVERDKMSERQQRKSLGQQQQQQKTLRHREKSRLAEKQVVSGSQAGDLSAGGQQRTGRLGGNGQQTESNLQRTSSRESPRKSPRIAGASPASGQGIRVKIMSIEVPTQLSPMDRSLPDTPVGWQSGPSTPRDSLGSLTYQIKLSLLAAKNLPAANLSGTSDPYAIITAGSETRFSSVVPGSRNPIWGEDFVLIVEELPVQIRISIYDWDIIWKSQELGCAIVAVAQEGETGADWVPLSKSGQVCVQVTTRQVPSSSEGSTAPGSRRRRSSQLQGQVATEVRQRPGPLQTIFGLPPDEVAIHSFSAALERSFLYHGRLFISPLHICFHSNVFAKQLKIVLPYEDVDQMRKSLHAYINPSITVVLRSGAGGHGVPPLASPDGTVKYKFASFWNRSHTLRVLQRAKAAFHEREEAEAQEEANALMRARSLHHPEGDSSDSSADVDDMSSVDADVAIAKTLSSLSSLGRPVPMLGSELHPAALPAAQPFLDEDVLVSMLQDMEVPCTAAEYFQVILADQSHFVHLYRGKRKDTELKFDKWTESDQYGGLIREMKFRSLCNSPMCPPTTRMTEWQHSSTSADHSQLVFEAIQQAHDVPFGSYFEVHARWTATNTSPTSCSISMKMGVHFKKWLMMQGKIKGGAANEYKQDAMLYLQLAREEIERWHVKGAGKKEMAGSLAVLAVTSTELADGTVIQAARASLEEAKEALNALG